MQRKLSVCPQWEVHENDNDAMGAHVLQRPHSRVHSCPWQPHRRPCQCPWRAQPVLENKNAGFPALDDRT
eukprot:272673-Pyramimonas_sp.AAC.1